MNKIILLIILFLNIIYSNCSACSQNTESTTDEQCSKLAVDDKATQICRKNPSSNGCKQTNILCNEKTDDASYKICSNLSVSSNNINTHICTMKIYSDCESILKKKYGLPDEEELLAVKDDLFEGVQFGEIPGFPLKGIIFFSTSLGAFLPMSICQFCKEEDLCTNVKYVDSDEKCRKLKISINNNNNYQCVKNPKKNTSNCIETNNCTDITIGASNEICASLSTNEKVCIKDPSKDRCIEADLCKDFKFISSTNLDICSSLKVSDNSYMKCIKKDNGCIETKYKCEEREIINNVNEEICNNLETNDNTEKCIMNNDGNNCKLIKYCNYAEGANNNECQKFPVQNEGNICVKKKGENICEEISKNNIDDGKVQISTQNEVKYDEEISQSQDKKDEVTQSQDKKDEVTQSQDKIDKASQSQDKNEEVSQSPGKTEEISQIPGKTEEVHQNPDKTDEISQSEGKKNENARKESYTVNIHSNLICGLLFLLYIVL